MNPADVAIRPVDGGFVIEWLETIDTQLNGMAFNKREAVRSTMKDALKLLESVLNQKEMLRKAGKLDYPDDRMIGGTQFFQGQPPGRLP